MPRTKPVADADVFDVDAIEIEDEGPACTFKLGGRMWDCRPLDAVSSWLVDELAAGAAQQATTLVKISDFFAAVLVEDQIADFLAMVNTPKSPLKRGHFAPLMEHVATKLMGGRPTQPSSSSQGGRRRIAATSKGALSSPDTDAERAG